MISKLNNIIDKNIVKIFMIFLFIQPFLDVIAAVMLYHFQINFISSLIRFIFLMFCIYYLFFIKKHKMPLVIILTYSLIFIVQNIYYKEISNIYFEIKMLLNNIYLPIILLFMIDIFKDNKINMKYIYIIFIIYILFIFIPDILNIGFDSYAYSKVGSAGLFFSANAIGSIISMLFPILLAYLVSNKRKILLPIFLLIYFFILFKMGTKAPLLCSSIVIIYYFILLFINLFKKKKSTYIFLSFIMIFAFILLLVKLLPYTAFYKNLVIHLNFLNVKKVSDLFNFKYIDHFLFGSRLSFFKDTFKIYLNSSIFQKLFGIGYTLNNNYLKISEMDYLDTFIHQGIIGFIVIYFTYFKCIFQIFKNYIKNFIKNFKNINITSIIISLVTSILCALLTGHVLSTPSVSIFVSLIIIIIYNKNIQGEIK